MGQETDNTQDTPAGPLLLSRMSTPIVIRLCDCQDGLKAQNTSGAALMGGLEAGRHSIYSENRDLEKQFGLKDVVLSIRPP